MRTTAEADPEARVGEEADGAAAQKTAGEAVEATKVLGAGSERKLARVGRIKAGADRK